MSGEIEYSEKYEDDVFEYRHVILPREVAKKLPKPMRILTEQEWRQLGVTQSRGWYTAPHPIQPTPHTAHAEHVPRPPPPPPLLTLPLCC